MKEMRIWGLVASGAWASVIKDLYSNTQREIINFDFGEIKNENSLFTKAEKWIATSSANVGNSELHCDAQRNDERKFAELIGLYLTDWVDRGEIDGLVVVASPRTLGDLRHVYTTQVSQKIVRQISQTRIPKRDPDVLDYFNSVYAKSGRKQ